MYRRYSQVGDGNMPLSQVNRNRVKNIIILLLLAALAAMLVISIPLMQNRDSSHSMHVQMIQRECKSAYDDAKVLSRNAGADSTAALSRIRCNIYAIRTINTLSASEGGQLLEDERLLTLQNTVDRFLTNLTTGGLRTGEYTTTLQNALTELQDIVNTLN